MIPTRPEEEGSRHTVVGDRYLTGRTALVTGAGRGLGRAISRRLVELGAHVALGDNDASALEQTASLLNDAAGTVTSHLFDVADAESVRAAVASIGRLEILVNNAGICPLTAPDQISEAEWDRVMAVNLKGAFLCVQAAWPGLQESGWGRIINISSLAGQTGGISVGVHYAASKAGLLAMTKSLARLLAPHGVTVNAIAPGAVATGLTANWPEQIKQDIRSKIPLGRFLQPEEIAGVVEFLCSASGAAITGATIDVNAGLLMR